MTSEISFSMKRTQQGFVLVATLWVLAALTLFVGYFSVVIDKVQNQAYELKQKVQADLQIRATEATVLYLAATKAMSYAGLKIDNEEVVSLVNPLDGKNVLLARGNEIRLDGRLYSGVGESLFGLQDAGSLISLRGEDYIRLERLLEQNGLARGQSVKLVSRLRDYMDRDKLLHVDGAEEGDYLNRGKIPPTNRHLVSPRQINNVLGWEEPQVRAVMAKVLPELTIYVGGRNNFNSMTIAGMRTLGIVGIDEQSIQKILAARTSNSFNSLSQVNLVTGTLLPVDQLSSPLFPSRYLRLVIKSAHRRQSEWVGITLTPNSTLAPWQIDYRFVVEEQTNIDNLDESNGDNARENPTDSASVLFR